MREFSKVFYQSKQWRNCRKAFLISKYNRCERCGNRANMVHHKKKITPRNINNPSVTLDWDNLEALCTDCHAKAHISSKPTVDGVSFDGNGNIVYTKKGG